MIGAKIKQHSLVAKRVDQMPDGLHSSGVLGKLFNLSTSQFSHLYNEQNKVRMIL